jgi:hypothetical protein
MVAEASFETVARDRIRQAARSCNHGKTESRRSGNYASGCEDGWLSLSEQICNWLAGGDRTRESISAETQFERHT